MDYKKKYLKYKKKYLGQKQNLIGGGKVKLADEKLINEKEMIKKLERHYDYKIEKKMLQGNISFQLDKVRPITVESLFVLDTTKEPYIIRSYFDEDEIIPEVKKLADSDLYWSGITIDGLYFLKYNVTTIYVSYQPINTQMHDLVFKKGLNKDNINLNIKPSPYSILQLLYKIWDTQSLKEVDIPLMPFKINKINFDRSKNGKKFFHSFLKKLRFTDNDGVWFLNNKV